VKDGAGGVVPPAPAPVGPGRKARATGSRRGFTWSARPLPPAAWAALLGILAAACAAPFGVGRSWHLFAFGARLVVDAPRAVAAAGGVHLYPAYPNLQIGPLALAALPSRLLPALPAELLALLVMSVAGIGFLYYLSWRPDGSPMARAGLFFGAVVFLPVWSALSWHTGHLDDAIALEEATVALDARLRHRPLVAALALAAAVDAKPWAVFFLRCCLTAR